MHITATINLTINVSDTIFSACLASPETLRQQLTTAQEEAIQAFVFDHLADKDGAPQLTDFEVKSMTYNPQTSKGRFRLAFQISRRFCCADVESCANDYLDFDFSYSKQQIQAEAHYFSWNLDN